MKRLLALIAMMVMCVSLSQAQSQKKGTAKMSVLTATASSHSVALTCTPPTTGTIPTGYFFYRATTPGGENIATPLNTTQTATCAYTDTTVVGNTTYYYKATSNCSTCSPPSQSGFSNEATANVPPDVAPNPPTGLTTGPVSLYHAPLFWSAPDPQSSYTVAKYRVYRGVQATMPNPTLIATLNPSILNYTDTKCKGTKYYYVKAYDRTTTGIYQLSDHSNIVTAICQ